MKRRYILLSLIAGALLFLLGAGESEAAKSKGKVVLSLKEKASVCEVIKAIYSEEKAKECDTNSTITQFTVVEGGKIKKAKKDQNVILKAKSTGKVVAKVIYVPESGLAVKDAVEVIGKQEKGVIWQYEGGWLLLEPEKEFVPALEETVKMKIKAQKQAVEGC